MPVALLLVVAQGLVFTVHNDLVLARTDTRSTARDWMVAHIPAGHHVAVEPIVPKEWFADGARLPDPTSHRGYRWVRFVRSVEDGRAARAAVPGRAQAGRLRQLRASRSSPATSTTCASAASAGSSRARCSPAACSTTRAACPRRSATTGRSRARPICATAIAPFAGPDADHYFQYDLAFNFAPLRYDRPGPAVRVHRLRDCTPR